MFTTNGINHMAFVTLDMDATVKFYTEVMNFPLTVVSYAPEAMDGDPGDEIAKSRVKHYFFDCGNGNNVAFFSWHENLPPGYDTMGGDAHHIAYNVRTEPELDDARAHMQAKGLEVSPVLDHGYLKSIYTRDPNGIVVEVSCFVQPCNAAHPYIDDPDPTPAARAHLGDRFARFKTETKVRHEDMEPVKSVMASG